MVRNEILKSIVLVCDKLRKELPEEEYSAGWTKTKQLDVLKYFEMLEVDIRNGVEIPYSPLVKTLDSVGIGEGELLEDLMKITNQINTKS